MLVDWVFLFIVFLAGYLLTIFKGNPDSTNPHLQHQQMANFPGMQGDRTLRYTVSFNKPTTTPNQPTSLQFRINNANTGSPITILQKLYEKPMHLIIVDDSLDYFSHQHPTLKNDTFEITTQFPKTGNYRLYAQFQPLQAIEQQVAFVQPVGDGAPHMSTQPLDTNFTKTVDADEDDKLRVGLAL